LVLRLVVRQRQQGGYDMRDRFGTTISRAKHGSSFYFVH
jgi:hypothetical protein